MIASAGIRIPFRLPPWNTTSPNISGLSSPDGFANSTLTFAVRVFGSRSGSMKAMRPANVRSGNAFSVSFADMPTFTCLRSVSYASASTQTRDRSTISNGMSPAFTRMPGTTSFFVTTPVAGEKNVIVRVGSPVRSRRSSSDRGTSQSSSLRRAAATSASPSRDAPPAATRRFRVSSASRSSCCAERSSGL